MGFYMVTITIVIYERQWRQAKLLLTQECLKKMLDCCALMATLNKKVNNFEKYGLHLLHFVEIIHFILTDAVKCYDQVCTHFAYESCIFTNLIITYYDFFSNAQGIMCL